MKKLIQITAVVVWLLIIFCFYKLDILSGDMNNIITVANANSAYKVIIFIILSTVRITAFIPSAVFMILGGMMFSPVRAFLYTAISVFLSEAVLYVASRTFIGEQLKKRLEGKYSKLYKMIDKNNVRILALGVLCPVAPSDVVCFLAASTNLGFKKFIITVLLANMPMMLLYSFLGDSFLSNSSNSMVIAAIVILIGAYCFYIWNKEQRKYKLA
jgi:uncharacterized membrane protein YdjX (TVP38/TMEM64 family)